MKRNKAKEKAPRLNTDPCISTKDGTYIAQTTYDTLSGTCEHNINADTLFIAASKTIVVELLTEIKRLKEKCGEEETPSQNDYCKLCKASAKEKVCWTDKYQCEFYEKR